MKKPPVKLLVGGGLLLAAVTASVTAFTWVNEPSRTSPSYPALKTVTQFTGTVEKAAQPGTIDVPEGIEYTIRVHEVQRGSAPERVTMFQSDTDPGLILQGQREFRFRDHLLEEGERYVFRSESAIRDGRGDLPSRPDGARPAA